MKKYILLLIACISLLISHAQKKFDHRMFIGIEGGMSVSKPQVIRSYGNDLYAPAQVNLASTGFNMSVETFRNLFFEAAIGIQTHTVDRIAIRSSTGGYKNIGNDVVAFNTSWRCRYDIRINKYLELWPMVGFNFSHHDLYFPESPFFRLFDSYKTVTNSGVTYDSLYQSVINFSSVSRSLQTGLDISFNLLPRLKIALGGFYCPLRSIFREEEYYYTRTNQTDQMLRTWYRDPSLAFKISCRWHLANMVSPQKRMKFYE